MTIRCLKKSMMKKYYSYFTILFLLTSYHVVHAQYAPPMPVTTTIKTPYGNVPHTYYVPSIHHHYNYGQGDISARHEFTVVLTNDSTFKTMTKINLTEKGKDNSITVKGKVKKEKREIFPKDTKYISRVSPEGRIYTGVPADSCWLFKTVQGEINGYSFLAEASETLVFAIQQGNDGAIVPLTKENLLPMVESEARSSELAQKGKLHKALLRYNSQIRAAQRFQLINRISIRLDAHIRTALVT
jgi:hypothetical protein